MKADFFIPYRSRTILLLASIAAILAIPNGCKKVTETKDITAEAPVDQLSQKKQQVDLALVADNFSSPIGLVAVPDGEKHDDKKSEDRRLFVIDQVGKI